jgi:CRP-like cAMP-binding protein
VKLRYVGNAPFFSSLSEQEQERISQRMHLEHRRNSETLFHKGDDSNALYLVKSGWVRLVANGGTALASQGPGSLVGETDLFLERPRSLGAILTTDAELWVLTKEDLADLIAENPRIGLKLTVAFGAHLALFDRYLVDHRLKTTSFLSGLGDDVLAAVAHRLTPLEVKKGDSIIQRGDPPEALFIVESGEVDLHSSEEGGDFSELGAGETFGEMALLTGKPYAHSAQAASDVILWALPAAEFDALTEEYPQVRLALSEALREPLLPQDQSRAAERLGTMPLFSGLPEEVLWAVAERLLLCHVPAREMVFEQGSPGDALYLIDSGQVEITSDERDGPSVLTRLGTDEVFGEMALLTGKPRSMSARAATHANLWVLYRSDFDDLINRYPSISLALSRVLSERLAAMDRKFTESHLRGLKLLTGLSSSQLEDVSGRLKPVRFRQGEVILREGDTGEEMFFIESGRVRVVRGKGPNALLLAELGAGDLFGEMALLTGMPRSATVTALSDLNLWSLSQADFDDLVIAYPNLALALSRLLSERLQTADERFLGEPSAPVVALTRPKAAPKPSRAARPKAKARPKAARSLTSDLSQAWDGAVAWFAGLSRGAKVRLIVVTMLLAWLFLIVAPVVVIQTLAAEDVTNLEGAIAFVQTATPTPAEAVAAGEVPAPAAAVPVQSAGASELAEEVEALPLEAPAPVNEEPLLPAEEPVLPADDPVLPADSPVPPVDTVQAVTPTPWIIVVTNTPLPPTDTPVPPTPTPTEVPPTATSVPQKPPRPQTQPTSVPTENPQPPRQWDPRLDALGVNVQPAGVKAGQYYWRLVEARWENEAEAAGAHSIYIEVVDENGNRVVGQTVEIRWASGSLPLPVEDKPYPEYGTNFAMYNTLGSYSVRVGGLPSDVIVGLGLGTAEQPAFTIHTNFFLTFQKVKR